MIYRQQRLMVVATAIIIAAIAVLIITMLPIISVGFTEKQSQNYDLDQDNLPEHYVLEDQKLVITKEGQELWRSPADWQVTSFHVADVTHDEVPDLLLVVWKRGSFGHARPFWHTGQNQEFTCHLYVYNLINQRLKPIWMSSALDRPIKDMIIRDSDDDGRNELHVTEYHSWWQRFSKRARANKITTWQWKDWGFCRLK